MKLKRIPKQRTLVRSPRPMPGLRRAASTTAFARRLAARYMRSRATRRSGDLPLVNAQSMIVQYLLRRHGVAPAQAMFAPLRGCPPAALELRRDRKSAHRSPRFEDRPSAPPVLIARAGHHTLLLRIVQRTQRIEIDRKSAPPVPGHVGAARSAGELWRAGAASLPLAVPASAGAASVTPAARPADPVFSPKSGEWEAVAAPGAAESDRRHAAAPRMLRATAVPEQEIEHLADRVIGTIDRRIAAQRERLGRP